MGLMQLNSEGLNKIETTFAILKECEPKEGYYVSDSGGKDSTVVVDLCKRAGVKFDAHYCVSPIDPPEVYKFLKEYRPETQWDYHARGFAQFNKGYPTRRARWCCQYIKESGGINRTVVTGIRWAESASRKSRCMLENSRNKKQNKTFLHIIICWSDAEVWEYIRMFALPYLTLYDNGWKRVGCIGCPMSTNQLNELKSYPKITKIWRKIGDNFFDNHPDNKTVKALGTKEEYWNWWLSWKSVKDYLNEKQGILIK